MALPHGTKRERVIVLYLCNYSSNYTSMETWAPACGASGWMNEWMSRCCSSFRHIHHVLRSSCSWKKSSELLIWAINVKHFALTVTVADLWDMVCPVSQLYLPLVFLNDNIYTLTLKRWPIECFNIYVQLNLAKWRNHPKNYP